MWTTGTRQLIVHNLFSWCRFPYGAADWCGQSLLRLPHHPHVGTLMQLHPARRALLAGAIVAASCCPVPPRPRPPTRGRSADD